MVKKTVIHMSDGFNTSDVATGGLTVCGLPTRKILRDEDGDFTLDFVRNESGKWLVTNDEAEVTCKRCLRDWFVQKAIRNRKG